MVITNSFSRSSLKLSWMIILPYTHSGYVCFIADNPLGECLKAVILFSQCCVQLQDKMLYNEIFEFKLQYKKMLFCVASQANSWEFCQPCCAHQHGPSSFVMFPIFQE